MKTTVKRICATVLAVLLAASMTACAASPSSGSNQGQITLENPEEHWQNQDKQYTVAVQISAGADAILYLNDTTVSGVAFLSNQAKELFPAETVLGKEYSHAFCGMVSAASYEGALASEPTVAVKIVGTKIEGVSLDYVYDTPIASVEAINQEAGSNIALTLGGKTQADWISYRDSADRPADDLLVPVEGSEVDCKECRDAKILTCEQCGGAGEYACTSCNGTSSAACDACNGLGLTNPEDSSSTCPSCNGTLEEPCTDCKNGVIICDGCSGEGTYACPSCSQE